jgi:hypothetical protein
MSTPAPTRGDSRALLAENKHLSTLQKKTTAWKGASVLAAHGRWNLLMLDSFGGPPLRASACAAPAVVAFYGQDVIRGLKIFILFRGLIYEWLLNQITPFTWRMLWVDRLTRPSSEG